MMIIILITIIISRKQFSGRSEWLGWSRRFLALIKFPLLFIAGASQRCDSPKRFTNGRKGEELKCPFPAHIVSWFKDNRPFINGTDDLYQMEEWLSNGNVRSKLFFSFVRTQHAGFYTCKANTSHNNTRSCEVEVIVLCKHFKFH